jgi:MoaA/NifB/PqqE/SkfB family radical SAM enzyme
LPLPIHPDEPSSQTPRLFKKKVADELPVTAQSSALFRFGEQCNYRCPMCSNTGARSLFFRDTPELLRRAAFLHERGFRRAVVTGGEATIHPGFWTVVEQLAAYGMKWDINTHGRSFAEPGFAKRSFDIGLERAIVSLHSFDPPTSAAIFGVSEESHHGSVRGVAALLDVGVEVMLNCVLSRLNVDQLDTYLQSAVDRLGRGVRVKFVFPTTIGKGGEWREIATLRYDDVREPVRAAGATAARLGLRVSFESFPSCVLADPTSVNFGRSTFGESHYLDDATGDRIYPMRHIEAELSAYGEQCLGCAALRRCPGVSRRYASKYGVAELEAFPSPHGAAETAATQ